MVLSKDTFLERYHNKDLHIALVGMSNAGKSYRARALADELGFFHYDVDAAIEKALALSSMEALAQWLGYPNAPQHTEHAARYLELENEHTRHALEHMYGHNSVVDTTGSVVHLPEDTMTLLHERRIVVHLQIDTSVIDILVERFFEHPKPIIWGDMFIQEKGESLDAALRQSYPRLLAERLKRYNRLAHIVVPAEKLRDTTAEETVHIIANHI